MQTENNIFLQNQKNALTMMIRPTGESIIAPLILDVVEKLGKYQFIYDYQVRNAFWDSLIPPTMLGQSLVTQRALIKEGGSNANMIAIAPRENVYTLPIMPSVSYTVNPKPQVGTFSKGNIVNVLRFDGYYAIIQNPNYVEPDTNKPKGFFGDFDLKNQKEFTIPKEYLTKVKDNFSITIQTGINFGANPKPQSFQMPKDPNVMPIKPKLIPELDNEVVLEQNANFVLNQDYKYNEKNYCPPNAKCKAPRIVTINAGTKVTGRLIRRNNNDSYVTPAGFIAPSSYFNFLEIKGKGTDLINIPIEYLTREIQNTTSNNGRTPVSVISLVDKKIGKCNETGIITTMDYNPCRVSAIKGQTYNGFIEGSNFYSNDYETALPINEYQIIQANSGTVVPVQNNNNNLLMIAGAFLAGYIIFGNSKSSN
jgi:hypothetical protein